MKQLYFNISNKGGVGKSTVAKAFADYLRKNKISSALFDTDNENRSLSKIYGAKSDAPLVGVGQYNLDQEDQARSVISKAVSIEADILLYDLRGGALNILLETFNQDTPEENAEKMINFFSKKDIQLNFLVVFDIEDSAVKTAIDLINLFGPNVRYYFIENIPKGKEYDRALSLWLDHPKHSLSISGTKKTVRNEMNEHGKYIKFPRLHPAPAGLIKAQKETFSFAVANPELVDLEAMDAEDVESWLEKTDAIFKDITSKE